MRGSSVTTKRGPNHLHEEPVSKPSPHGSFGSQEDLRAQPETSLICAESEGTPKMAPPHFNLPLSMCKTRGIYLRLERSHLRHFLRGHIREVL